jgi:sugar phosphate isomerase/epimerase
MGDFRLGTTSYILPDEILPNVRFLSDKVDDIELVLFEIDDETNNLPDTSVIHELGALAQANNLTYTVHLPLDLRMGAAGEPLHRSLELAHAVIERTQILQPWAYVLHLDGEEADDYDAWVDQAVESLEQMVEWVGAPGLLAIENLEGYPLDFIDPVLDRIPVGRCVDVGHLWLDGHDPVDFLQDHLERTRVVHIHGIGTRDHQSLADMEQRQLRAVLKVLEERGYEGVLTIEVFNLKDFESSLKALRTAGMS